VTARLPIVPSGAVVVGPDVAAYLLYLLRPGLRSCERDHERLPPAVADAVQALELVAGERRTPPAGDCPHVDTPEPAARIYADTPEPAARIYADTPAARWCSTSDAAELLGVDVRTVRRMAHRGELSWRSVAGAMLVDHADVLAVADERAARSDTP
jgi:excisionase family DNA binding protein